MRTTFLALLLAVSCGGTTTTEQPTDWHCQASDDGTACTCYAQPVDGYRLDECPPHDCCWACGDSCECGYLPACQPVDGCWRVDGCHE